MIIKVYNNDQSQISDSPNYERKQNNQFGHILCIFNYSMTKVLLIN